MRDNKADWAVHEAQARAITNGLNELGQSWSTRNVSQSPEEWQTWHAVRLADGLELSFGWPEAYGAARLKAPRVVINGIWPRDQSGAMCIPTHGRADGPRITEITADASKLPATIAKDITRRLLPHFEPSWRAAMQMAASHDVYRALTANTIAAILAAGVSARISQNSKESVYLGSDSYAYSASAQGDSVRFEAFSCPVDVAIAILRACRKPTLQALDDDRFAELMNERAE